MSSTSMYWIRNDHRLDDNRALTAFCTQSSHGVSVSFETSSLQRAGRYRRQFYFESLKHYHEQLRAHHQNTIHCEHNFKDSIKEFLVLNKIGYVFYSTEPTSEERQEEEYLKIVAADLGISVYPAQQDTMILKKDVPFSLDKLPAPFTKFRNIVEATLVIEAPLPTPSCWPKGLTIENTELSIFNKHISHPLSVPFVGGEAHAQKHLEHYFWQTEAASSYKDTRNGLMDWDHSTKFSPWLSTGNISPRRIYHELKKYESSVVKNDSTYWIFFELLWRDYFHFYAEQMGTKLFTKQQHSPNDTYQSELLFKNWCSGQTGDDFVDAHMTELLQTGWMSNRGRQNVASYLAKKIKLPWAWGAEWFEKMLIDYDAANNWGNWSYFSGVGTDPRDRAFNTQTQAKHYDPQGEYQKKWLDKRNTSPSIENF